MNKSQTVGNRLNLWIQPFGKGGGGSFTETLMNFDRAEKLFEWRWGKHEKGDYKFHGNF